MTVGLDYRSALKPNSRRRGIGRYTHELTRNLLATCRHLSFSLYTIPGLTKHRLEGNFGEHPVFYLKRPSRLNWAIEAALFSWHARKDRLDLFHAMDPLAIPARVPCPLLVSVHDLIPFIFAREMRGQIPLDYRVALKYARLRYRSADRILTLSEHSKQDICRLLGVLEDRVEVVPLGSTLVPSGMTRSEAERKVEEQFGIAPRYLLYVGGTDFRKNLGRLLEAFALMRSQGYPGRLVLVGETFSMEIPEVMRLRERVSQLGLEDGVVFQGYVGDEHLAALFEACDFFVFPSLYEGFGLPVLEAMRCGAPLLISRASSMPEVAGDSAFYFDPEDVPDMAEAFRIAVSDPDEVERRRQRGLVRAAEFSWEKAAHKVGRIYDELLEARR
jgi:glycosyltransferase involved in cell wall biosynthesis